MTASTFFAAAAATGGVVMVAQLALSAMGADGGNADSADGHDVAGDGLQLLSVRALSAGVAFFGVGGLAARVAGWPVFAAVACGTVAGAVAMVGVAAAMRAMLRLQHDGSVRIERAVGLTGTVYVSVPALREGVGKILITQQGRTLEYQAVTPDAQPLETGTLVVVVEVCDHDTVEVVPLPPVDGVS